MTSVEIEFNRSMLKFVRSALPWCRSPARSRLEVETQVGGAASQ